MAGMQVRAVAQEAAGGRGNAQQEAAQALNQGVAQGGMDARLIGAVVPQAAAGALDERFDGGRAAPQGMDVASFDRSPFQMTNPDRRDRQMQNLFALQQAQLLGPDKVGGARQYSSELEAYLEGKVDTARGMRFNFPRAGFL